MNLRTLPIGSNSVKYMHQDQHKIGLVVNPISGMGGSVGLKGTDGQKILNQARELGAEPEIQNRVKLFLSSLKSQLQDFFLLSAPGVMGESICVSMNIPHQTIPENIFSHPIQLYSTTKYDTQTAVKYFREKFVDILVFFGGDGTARDILEVIQQEIPCIGIPGGVKVYSSVFSATPTDGAELVVKYLKGQAPLMESEVLDIDENAFRKDIIEVALFGYMKIPHVPMLLQGMKQASPNTDDEIANQQAIAKTIIEEMKSDTYYLLGPGTTVQWIAKLLGIEKTLLGVDIVKNKVLIARDVNEKKILETIQNKSTVVVVSPIGNQGFVFGRGNLQITARVMKKIEKENIRIICSRSKLKSLPYGYIRTDIRNLVMDAQLRGFYRVLIDYNEYKMVKMI